MKTKNRSVVDTGILISAFAFGGVPKQALQIALTYTDIYVSLEILNEYKETPLYLLKSHKIDLKQFQALI